MKFECPCSGCGLQYDTWLELVEHTQEHGAQTVPGDTSTQRTGNLTIHFNIQGNKSHSGSFLCFEHTPLQKIRNFPCYEIFISI